MEKICEELDKSKAELQNLKLEYRSKVELYDYLEKAHADHLVKLRGTNSKLEKQAQELNDKAEEIHALKQACQDVKSSLTEKESVIKHLTAAHDKSRSEFGDKCQKLEEENNKLVFALVEANEKNIDKERKMIALLAENEAMKGRLAISEKKCFEAEKIAKAAEKLRGRDGVLLKLEEDNRDFEEKLKWRNEQFKHLEEAHSKLRDEFTSTKVGWNREKLTLVDEICSLQTNLDSQIRISEDLEKKLKMCNEVIAHEESRRKYLEAEVATYKMRFDNIVTEFQDEKSHFKHLTAQRDKEVSALRHSLGTKETFYKEVEYRGEKLELENKELMTSLKELQEAQIHQAGRSSTLEKLRKKLKNVEQMHMDCSGKHKANEIEWSSQLEKITADLNKCQSEIEVKDVAIEKLENQLEDCRFMRNVENDVILLMFKSRIYEAQLKLTDVEIEICKKKSRAHSEKKKLQMDDDLKIKKCEEICDALEKANYELAEERAKTKISSRTFELKLNNVEEEKQFMNKELENYKELLEESFKGQCRLKEHALQMKNDANRKLEKVKDDLVMANSLVPKNFCEHNEKEFESLIWKSIAQRLKCELEESLNLLKTLEASLLAQMEDVEITKHERADMFHQLEEKNSSKINNLENEVECLEQESFKRELEGAVFTQTWSEVKFEYERQNFVKLIEEKDQIIDDLVQRVRLLEQKFNLSLNSFSSQIAEKQVEVNIVYEAWEKILAAKVLAEFEIEVKKLMILELEKLSEEMGAKLRISDSLNYELNNEKVILVVDIMKLSSEMEALLCFIEGLSDKISDISDEDSNLAMALAGSLQLSHLSGVVLCRNSVCLRDNCKVSNRSSKVNTTLPSPALVTYPLYFNQSSCWRSIHYVSRTSYAFKCHASLVPNQGSHVDIIKAAASTAFTRSYNALQGNPVIIKLLPAVGIIVLAVWGIEPLMHQSRALFLNMCICLKLENTVEISPYSVLYGIPQKDDNWRKSRTHNITTTYIQPLMLWTAAILVCRALEPIALPTEPSRIVKKRLLNFIGSLSTVLAFGYCLSSVIQQAQKYFMDNSDSTDTRNMGYQFAGKAVYSAVWVAGVSLFMELLGFSTQKWLTAGGLGTVLLTLAGREIFTNFLSSVMIQATRPFVLNEWIQTKIEGYEVSGTVEHVGWWSPTIIRGEDREAIHIPNHKFSVNIVRNLSQKTHWRIKTHLAISHLDVNKLNIIVADMRKVLAKNPQVEQQRLHRRVFLDNVDPENQSLLIMVSCFVKTSHHEEYLRVKEIIMLDLLRVISHHGARLATPIRTVHKMYSDADIDSAPFGDSFFNRGGAKSSNSPYLLIEPSYKISGEEKSKSQKSTVKPSQDIKSTAKPTAETKVDSKVDETQKSDSKSKEKLTSDSKTNLKSGETPNSSEIKNDDVSETSQLKQDGARSAGLQQSTSRTALEDNIVLGVALEGSKRTLPIEDGIDTPPVGEAKELAGVHGNQNGSSPSKEKNKKDKSE
ncbi:hypothetical protein ACFE04_017409 [Oxalis oulophora]